MVQFTYLLSFTLTESVMYESESHRQIIGIQELYLSDHEYVKNGTSSLEHKEVPKFI